MKVSVITTLFNYRHYVGDAISSFLKQDFQDSEMIIVDDASTDNPLPVIEPYLGERVKYIRLDSNKGYSHAKNVGIKASKAEILVMLDADDMFTKRSLSMRYKKLQEGFDLVHGPASDIVEDGQQTISDKHWKKWLDSDKGPKAYKFIHAQTVMLKKQLHREIGLYDESLRYKSDREMWARILHNGYKIGYVNDYVCMYRLHSKQMHRSKAKLAINDALQQEVLSKIAQRAKAIGKDIEMLP